MRIIDITHPPQSLWIGREGENTFRPVSFECANWFSAYPNATIAAYYQPYGAADPYPLVLSEDGTKRIWNPLLAELVKGDGELQIVLMNGETVGTSAIIPTKVDRSLISNADHPASETPAWPVKVVQDVTEQADRAEEAASHYPKIVNGVWFVWDAARSEFVSTGISAQGENGVSPTVTVTAITGGHRVTITDADGDHTFDVMDGQVGPGGSTVYVTPEQFGAVGDGVADDTAAVRQAMQNPAVALQNTYKVTEAISCAANVVVGNGDAKILTSGDCLNFSDNVFLSDFAIETPYQTDGVAIKAQKDITADRLAITGGRIGIRADGSYYKTVVRGCTFKNLWGDSAAAVHVLFAGITEFSGNFVENISNDLDRDADGVRIWQSKDVENVCAEIQGNEFHNCRGRFIKASTYNCSIHDNYCHNDSGFATITNAIGIDVQKGNSDVRNNMIVASVGINISARVDDVSHHIVEHNTFKLVESSGSKHRAISITDYGDTTTKTDVTIRENFIDWGNNVSIYLPYVGNSIIRALSNHVVGRQGDAVSFRGTFDATCRFEMLGNLNDDYTYFARFSGCIPNVLGDRKIFAADPIDFSLVLPMTSYVANTRDLDGFGNTAFLETLGGVSSFSIQLSANSQFGVYKTNGQAVYYFAGAYVNKVNGKTGVVTLTAADVGALPSSTVIPTVPQMATQADMSDWTSGKTVDAATLKTTVAAAGLRVSALEDDVDALESAGYQTASDVQTAISPLQTKSITDTGGYFTTDTVEGALQEIGAELAGVNTLIGSGVIT